MKTRLWLSCEFPLLVATLTLACTIAHPQVAAAASVACSPEQVKELDSPDAGKPKTPEKEPDGAPLEMGDYAGTNLGPLRNGLRKIHGELQKGTRYYFDIDVNAWINEISVAHHLSNPYATATPEAAADDAPTSTPASPEAGAPSSTTHTRATPTEDALQIVDKRAGGWKTTTTLLGDGGMREIPSSSQRKGIEQANDAADKMIRQLMRSKILPDALKKAFWDNLPARFYLVIEDQDGKERTRVYWFFSSSTQDAPDKPQGRAHSPNSDPTDPFLSISIADHQDADVTPAEHERRKMYDRFVAAVGRFPFDPQLRDRVDRFRAKWIEKIESASPREARALYEQREADLKEIVGAISQSLRKDKEYASTVDELLRQMNDGLRAVGRPTVDRAQVEQILAHFGYDWLLYITRTEDSIRKAGGRIEQVDADSIEDHLKRNAQLPDKANSRKAESMNDTDRSAPFGVPASDTNCGLLTVTLLPDGKSAVRWGSYRSAAAKEYVWADGERAAYGAWLRRAIAEYKTDVAEDHWPYGHFKDEDTGVYYSLDETGNRIYVLEFSFQVNLRQLRDPEPQDADVPRQDQRPPTITDPLTVSKVRQLADSYWRLYRQDLDDLADRVAEITDTHLNPDGRSTWPQECEIFGRLSIDLRRKDGFVAFDDELAAWLPRLSARERAVAFAQQLYYRIQNEYVFNCELPLWEQLMLVYDRGRYDRELTQFLDQVGFGREHPDLFEQRRIDRLYKDVFGPTPQQGKDGATPAPPAPSPEPSTHGSEDRPEGVDSSSGPDGRTSRCGTLDVLDVYALGARGQSVAAPRITDETRAAALIDFGPHAARADVLAASLTGTGNVVSPPAAVNAAAPAVAPSSAGQATIASEPRSGVDSSASYSNPPKR